MTPLKTLTFAALTLAAASAWAGTAADAVSVADPYVRAVPAGQTTTAAFMVLKNSDAKAHTLVKADNPASKASELHTHLMENGVMQMRPVKQIDVAAKGETKLQPGGLHIMMIGLKAPIKAGDTIPLTLTFEDGSSKKVDAKVGMPGGEMKSGEHMHGM